MYPLANPMLPLPMFDSPDARVYVTDKLDNELRNPAHVLFVLPFHSELLPWVTERMKARGYRAETQDFDNFVLLDFRRS